VKNQKKQCEAAVDLGRASRRTLGGPGVMFDYVRYIPWTGLSRD
jgi:hypothetical protein